MREFLLDLVKYHRVWIPRSLDGFNSGTHPGIHDMGPVFAGVLWQVPPPLDNENTGVTHLACPGLHQLETVGEINLILCTAGKSGTERLHVNIVSDLRTLYLFYLLDFALQMQHPACDLYSLGL